MIWVCLVLLFSTVSAQESEIVLPPPSSFVGESTVSLSVIRVNKDLPNYGDFMDACFAELQDEVQLKLDPLLIAVYYSLKDRDPLQRLLPLRAVRVDRPRGKEILQPTCAFSLGGFRGLQRLFYKNLLNGPDGEPFPMKEVELGEVALAPGWDQPGRARHIFRHIGTFFLVGSLSEARTTMDKDEREPNPEFEKYDLVSNGAKGFVLVDRMSTEQREIAFQQFPFLEPLSRLNPETQAKIRRVDWEGEIGQHGQALLIEVKLTGDFEGVAALPEGSEELAPPESGIRYRVLVLTRVLARYFFDVRP